jgi:hypothetical protein
MQRKRFALLGIAAAVLMVGLVACSRPTPVPGEETAPLEQAPPGGYPQPSQPEAAPIEDSGAYPGGIPPSTATAEAMATADAARTQGIGYPAPEDGTPGGGAQPAATP